MLMLRRLAFERITSAALPLVVRAVCEFFSAAASLMSSA